VRRNTSGSTPWDPRYFETLGTPVRLGREFREQDNPAITIELPDHPVPGQEAPQPPGPRAAVVNEAFVRHFFAGRPALGMHVAMGETYRTDKLFEIVGVVKDARYFSMRDAVEPMMFIPIWRMPAIGCAVVIRTTDARPQVAATLRREIAALDPTVPLLNVRTLEQDVDQVILVERLVGTLSAFFAGLALALSALGLYGVISFGVTRRTREIGIRVALGADRGSVLWLVFRDAVKMILLGTAIGIAGALAATRVIEGLLYGVKAQDPLSIAAAALILTAAAVAATLIPARRATRVEPMVALRYE
jgi:predicted permease